MARGRLAEEEIRILKENPYVQDVSDTRIIYTNAFKFHFIKEYKEGKKPTKIFQDAGFNPEILGSKRIERAAHRWKESYRAGSLGAYQDGTIRKRKRCEVETMVSTASYEACLDMIKGLQKENEILRAENELLKRGIWNG